MWIWIESTSLAGTVRDSLVLTALLSGLHVLGMTLLAGAALVRGLRWTDRGVTRGVRWGLAMSVVTGALLVAPRMSSAVENGFFEAKMLLIAAAVLFEWSVFGRASSADPVPAVLSRRLSIALWVAVACLGCAYILLE